MLPTIATGNVASATASTGYTVANSCRFNDDDSAYMHKTCSSAFDTDRWTISIWFKRGTLGIHTRLITCDNGDGSDDDYIRFDTDDKMEFMIYSGGVVGLLKPNRVFRDISAWYHLVCVWDSANGTAGNRMRMYINGVEETSFETDTNPSSGANATFGNTSHAIEIGQRGYNTSQYWDGYLAEVAVCDGQAYAASDFGEFDEDSPTIWKPKDISGLTFGTSGFYLDFEDSSNLGNDANGGTDLTEVNLAAADQMVDTPTNNFPTASPIFEWYYTANIAMAALSEGNLKSNPTSNQVQFCKVPFDMTGKVYFEAMPITQGYQVMGFGETLCAGDSASTIGISGNYADGINIYVNAGTEYLSICVNGSYSNDGGDNVSISAEDIVQFAYDADTGKAWLGVNNTWHDSGDPANGTNPICTFPASTRDNMHPCGSGYGAGDAFVWNFGQNSSFAGVKTAQGNQDGNDIGDFYYAPPSGFLALCSKNRSDTTIDDPEAYFQTKLYTGNGTTQSITLDGDTDMQPDLVWIKERNNDKDHQIADAVRGADLVLESNENSADISAVNLVTAFNSDGFSLGDHNELNDSSDTYVAWNWKESATAGFDIVSYTGTGSAKTEAHSLSAVPKFIIFKNRDTTADWKVYHVGIGAEKWLKFNTTDAAGDSAGNFNDTEPTSSVFSLGDDAGTNGDTNATIAYAFAEKQGFSKFGSYIGGSDPFVYLGFRPAFIMFKNASAVENYRIIDNKRDTYNPAVAHIYPNLSNAEGSGASYSDYCDFLSNGFKIRSGAGEIDGSGNTIIYMAFAEAPFVNSNGVPCNAR